MITRSAWRLHILLAFVLGAEILFAASLRESPAELEQNRVQGSSQTMLDALHILLANGEPDRERFGHAFAQELLASGDPRVRDFAFTNDVCRMADPEDQVRWLAQNMQDPLPAEWIRSFILQFRKVGGRTTRASLRMNRREFEWLMSGQEVEQDTFLEHLRTYNPLAYEHLMSYR